MENIKEANITNLTSLWETAGKPFGGFCFENGFNYCKVRNSDWPNKLWLKEELKQSNLNKIAVLISSSPELVFTYWDDFNSSSFAAIENCGFIRKSEQTGMSLKLNKKFKGSERLKFIQTAEPETAKTWVELYPRCFGYRISEEIINHSTGKIRFYLAVFEGSPIGTAITYRTGHVAGIHGVGVIPEMRRMGFAKEIMHFLLQQASDEESEYAVLQASALGKGIYLQMGFSEDFLMVNYILKGKQL